MPLLFWTRRVSGAAALLNNRLSVRTGLRFHYERFGVQPAKTW